MTLSTTLVTAVVLALVLSIIADLSLPLSGTVVVLCLIVGFSIGVLSSNI